MPLSTVCAVHIFFMCDSGIGPLAPAVVTLCRCVRCMHAGKTAHGSVWMELMYCQINYNISA